MINDDTNEIWFECGFPYSYYEVSSTGRCRRKYKKKTIKTPIKNRYGDICYQVRDDNKQKICTVKFSDLLDARKPQ